MRGKGIGLLLPMLAFAGIFACATAGQVVEKESEAEIHYQSGIGAMVKANWELAYFELGKAVRLKPDESRYHFALGTTQMNRKEYTSALDEFARTISLDPKFADAYNNAGVVHLYLQNWDEAIRYLTKALDQIDYETPENALANIGYAWFKKGDSAKALENLNRALAIRPEMPQPANNLAEVYIQSGRLDKAREVLLKLTDRSPNYVPGRLTLGIVFYKSKETAKAREEFNAVLRLAPKDSDDARTARSYLDLLD